MGFEEVLGQPRASLILMHPMSLPDPEGSSHGIGELGSEAFRFVDFLADSGTLGWQVLPLGHTGFKDSPYQTFSRFAGSPHLISVEKLAEAGDLTDEERACYSERVRRAGIEPHKIDYGWLFSNKIGSGPNCGEAILRQAHNRFLQRLDGDPRRAAFREFNERQRRENGGWLDDYAEFMAIKELHGHDPWPQWPEEFREAEKFRERREKILADSPGLARGVEFFQYLQFVFFEQWENIRQYAKEKGRILIGDLPWYVGYDSADVWARRKVFDLDAEGNPKRVAGVPPDAFSGTGQLWGNPLYHWRGDQAYLWWMESIDFILGQVDILRLDHFRAIDTYWVVPYEWAVMERTAARGYWEKGPGGALMEAIRARLEEKGRIAPGGQLPIIAEDLGCFDPLYASVEEYPEDFLAKNRYPISEDFSYILRNNQSAAGDGLDPETGEYSTRKATDAILDRYALPGMGILQFGFEGAEPYRPERMPPRSVTYTGTHDNDTSLGWYREKIAKEDIMWESGGGGLLREDIRAALREWDLEFGLQPQLEDPGPARAEPAAPAPKEEEKVNIEMIRVALGTKSCLAGAPMQDLLGKGSEGRMNLPGDSEGQWWTWRAVRDELDYTALAKRLRLWNEQYARIK